MQEPNKTKMNMNTRQTSRVPSISGILTVGMLISSMLTLGSPSLLSSQPQQRPLHPSSSPPSSSSFPPRSNFLMPSSSQLNGAGLWNLDPWTVAQNLPAWIDWTQNSILSRTGFRLKELEDEYVAFVDCPGFQTNEIQVSLEENQYFQVMAKKTCKDDSKSGDRNRFCAERSIFDEFRVGPNVDKENISVYLEDGVLRVHLPKKSKKKSRFFNIQMPSFFGGSHDTGNAIPVAHNQQNSNTRNDDNTGYFQKFKESVNPIHMGEELKEKVGEKVGEFGHKIHDVYEGQENKIRGAYEGAEEKLSGALHGAQERVSDTVWGAGERVSNMYHETGKKVQDVYDNTGEAAEQNYQKIKQNAGERLHQSGEKVASAADTIKQRSKEAAGNVGSSFRDAASALLDDGDDDGTLYAGHTNQKQNQYHQHKNQEFCTSETGQCPNINVEVEVDPNGNDPDTFTGKVKKGFEAVKNKVMGSNEL